MLGRDVVQLVSTAQLWAYQVGTLIYQQEENTIINRGKTD